MCPSSTTIDYNEDGTYSINLYLDDIAPIISGVRPYIFLDHYDKNLKGLNNLRRIQVRSATANGCLV